MARYLFVNRYFHPDHSATSQLLSDLAFALVREGMHVEVLTSRQLYSDPTRVLPREETIEGVKVHRVWTSRFGRGRLLPRAMDYLTFYLSATARIARMADSETVVITETDPPLMSVPATLAGKLRRAQLVNWTQDLFPEIARGLEVPGMRALDPPLRYLRNLSLRLSHTNVALGEAMADHLRGQGIPPEKIAIIHNWSLAEPENPLPVGVDHPLREEWGLAGKFVVGYSGNLGRAHDFATFLDAATALRDRHDIQFLFIGGGAQLDWMKREAASRGLANVVWKPYQPLERLPLSLSLPDLHLVSLQAHLEGLLFPSKLYAVLSAGRGILFVGDPKGEIARLVDDAKCGQAFAAGAGPDLAAAIIQIADHPGMAATMGENARGLWDRNFRRARALSTWKTLLSNLSKH